MTGNDESRIRTAVDTALKAFAETGGKVAAGAVLMFLGTTIWPYLSGLLLGDQPLLTIVVAPETVQVGDVVQLVVILDPQGRHFKGGVLAIVPDSNLALPANHAGVTLPAADAPFKVVNLPLLTAVAPGDKPVEFIIKRGNTPLLNTNPKSKSIKVLPRGAGLGPTPGDYSGIWDITINGFTGKLQVEKDTRRKIEGIYKIPGGGWEGTFEGFRDGTTVFGVRMTDNDQNSSFVVNAKCDDCSLTSDKFYFRGEAKQEHIVNGNWSTKGPPVTVTLQALPLQ